MRVVIIGPPGAGKGTQAAVLSNELGVPHISTGDLFREHVGDETNLGQRVKDYLDAGQLVPDQITNEMVRQRLTEEDCEAGFLLDGYPRTVSQAQMLADLLRAQDSDLDAVLLLDVPEDVVVERLLSRGRDDDSVEVIRRRQQVYQDETAPLLDFYSDRLVTVPAVGPIEDVTARALVALRTRA
ncbi:MAG TPA: adenylate kinase [Pseudonocardiaceae bacterium]|nr:adenylate kinase [Pseudonocardiaceae bacterium]